jgi:hypothetical protein
MVGRWLIVGLTLGTLGHFFFFLFFLSSCWKRRFCDCSFVRTELVPRGLTFYFIAIFIFFLIEKVMIDETKSQALIRIYDTFLMSVII